ncbi:P-loop NTPase fold protein [Actinomadura decatromicini]|uniref:AAA+ ATPase domain-containing protein n=1 Tax=Actinomadura decatromicini TaxID=2604572 RepID=A0A5D3FEM3_9ACTN|nr:P-loop NTPase fold protein [Actinomadura decatromicini]TYK46711.1 hypothetical protein FXF68_22940 [Actinomadura decatromicini]
MTGDSSENPRAEALREFGEELRAVLDAAGGPPLRRLEQVSERERGLRLSASTVRDKLAGRSAPTWEFVVTFVSVCRVLAGELQLPTEVPAFDLDHWRLRHTQLMRTLATETAPAPSEEVQRELAAFALPPLPSPLPPSMADFDRHWLLSLWLGQSSLSQSTSQLLVLGGPPGIGKTSLAVAFARHVEGEFPDGVLFANLAHLHPESDRVRTVLGGLLRALGVASDAVPETFAERTAALRDLLASRRLLIVLDDVSRPDGFDMIDALLREGDGRSLLLVTCTGTFAAPDLQLVDLEGVSEEDGLAILSPAVGPGRLNSDAALQFIELCGRSPLMLHLAGAVLTAHPSMPGAEPLFAPDWGREGQPEGWLLARLYESLGDAERLVLRRLALVDEHEELPRRLLPFLVGDELTPDEVDKAIDRLVDVHLLYTWQDGQVIRTHDPVREFARERAEEAEEAIELAAVRDRARRFFLMERGYRPQPEPTITRDYWTLRDRLSYSHYADAIAEFIRHRQTRPPLTIGLKAPWGAGKTSLMRMIQNNLDPRDGERPCTIRLDRRNSRNKPSRSRWRKLLRRASATPGSGVTNLEILLHADEPGPDDATGEPTSGLRAHVAKGAPVRAGDWRPTVWFNPWMYQNGEQIWAGLAHEIITQVTERLPVADRERFWLRLNLARIDRSVIRRRWYRLLAERLLPFLAVWVVAFLVTLAWLAVGQLVDPLRGVLRGLSAGVLGTGTVVLLVGGTGKTLSFLGKAASGPLSALVRKPDILGGSQRLLADQAKTGFDTIVPDPGYAGRLGFLHLVHSDMKRVLDLIATPERPLVVFVDDLDRCSPSAVTQVIEAVNLFLAGEFPNCVFVLGMEPGAVAAHVEVAYQDLVKAQRDGRLAGDWSTLGWRFLEKIVQLPLSVPAPGGNGEIDDYLRSLVEAHTPKPRPGSAPSGERRVARTSPFVPGDRRVRIRRQAPSPAIPLPDETPERIVEAPDTSSIEQIAEIESRIRARQPTPDTLRETALAVQRELLDLPEPLTPETLAAADRVVSDLYSDLDAHAVLARSLPVLGSRNPREIKRFVNLFRFYSFVAERQRLLGAPAPDQEQIAKLAAFAIRWPHVISMLGASTATAASEHPLDRLERTAREGDPSGWTTELRTIFPVFDVQSDQQPDPAASPALPPGWGDDLRTFLREGPEIAPIAPRFI